MRKFGNKESINISSLGISNEIVYKIFHLSEFENMNSFKKPNQRAWGFEKKDTTNAQTNTLDNFCAENNVENLDILKIDFQGSELNIIEGRHSLLSDCKIDLIYVEW